MKKLNSKSPYKAWRNNRLQNGWSNYNCWIPTKYLQEIKEYRNWLIRKVTCTFTDAEFAEMEAAIQKKQAEVVQHATDCLHSK